MMDNVIIPSSKPMDYPAPRVNPNVNYGLSVITMCQCRSVSCNKCTAEVEGVDKRRSYTRVETGLGEISVPSL